MSSTPYPATHWPTGTSEADKASDAFTHTGKQVLHRGDHFADAKDDNSADLICWALNAWDGETARGEALEREREA
jgi:hypothetical protein